MRRFPEQVSERNYPPKSRGFRGILCVRYLQRYVCKADLMTIDAERFRRVLINYFGIAMMELSY